MWRWEGWYGASTGPVGATNVRISLSERPSLGRARAASAARQAGAGNGHFSRAWRPCQHIGCSGGWLPAVPAAERGPADVEIRYRRR